MKVKIPKLIAVILIFLSINAESATKTDLSPLLLGQNPTLNNNNDFFDIDPSFISGLNSANKAIYLNIFENFKNKDYLTAQNLINKNRKRSPDEPSFIILQGLLDTQLGNQELAKKSFYHAAELAPSLALPHLALATLLFESDDYDKSYEHAKKSLAIDNKLVSSYLIIADIYLQSKKINKTEETLLLANDNVHGDIPLEIQVLKSLAEFYASQKTPYKIQPLIESFAEQHPDSPIGQTLLVETYYAIGEEDKAKGVLNKLIKTNSKDTSNRLLLAKILSQDLQNKKEVFSLLRDILNIDPSNQEALIFKTAYLVSLKEYPEALLTTDSIQNLFPKSSIGKVLSAGVYLAQNDLTNALANYQSAYAIDPNDKLLLNIVKLMKKQGNPENTIAFLEQVLSNKGGNTVVQFNLGTLYQEKNNFKQAKYHYESILKEDPKNVLVLNNLALLLYGKNNAEALKLAKKAYEQTPEAAIVADTYGYILTRQGDYAAGLKVMEEAAKLAPDIKDIQYHLAFAQHKNNNNSKAIEILQNILKNGDNFPESVAAKKLLDEL